jgi:hypothetical protein
VRVLGAEVGGELGVEAEMALAAAQGRVGRRRFAPKLGGGGCARAGGGGGRRWAEGGGEDGTRRGALRGRGGRRQEPAVLCSARCAGEAVRKEVDG